MKYEDSLEACLRAIRDGLNVEAAISAHPQHAAVRLRDDLTLASNLNSLSKSLPETSTERTAAHRRILSATLEAQHAARPRVPRRASTPRRTTSSWLPRGFAFAGGIGVLVAAIALFSSVGPLRNSAEAATIEGVVIEKTATDLTLETLETVETVAVEPDAEITDDTGNSLSFDNIEIGELLRIRGKRVAQGRFIARLINRQPVAALGPWCARHPDRCQALEQLQQRLQEQCQAHLSACEAIRQRVRELATLRVLLTRRDNLRQRCDQGGQLACRELTRFCSEQKAICQDAPRPK